MYRCSHNPPPLESDRVRSRTLIDHTTRSAPQARRRRANGASEQGEAGTHVPRGSANSDSPGFSEHSRSTPFRGIASESREAGSSQDGSSPTAEISNA